MANDEELLENPNVSLLRRDVRAWNNWRNEYGEDQPDFHRAILMYADLAEANLSNADLSHANLTRVNLTKDSTRN